MREAVAKALKILQEGGVILYPTDTIWGIGCDATNEEAVARIYKIKQREDSKSMLVLLDTENRLSSYVEDVPEVAWDLLDAAVDPLTVIYSGAKNLAKNLVAEDGSVGIRVADDDFCRQLIQRFKKPIVSTSANVSGRPSPGNFGEVDASLFELVDYVVEWRQEEMVEAKPSSIIKLGSSGEVKVIR